MATTRDDQIANRYTKAIEQLGSKEIDVRIGGIYALERVARDSARDHPTVMEVLTAFIREHSHKQWPLPDHPPSREQERSLPPDVKAAITVITRRAAALDTEPIDLSGASLAGAYLGGAILRDADLFNTTLTRVSLRRADLTRAVLVNANLTDAILIGAMLKDADLRNANLHGARLTDAFIGGARLSGVRWPEDVPVPEGWKLDDSGRLVEAH